MRRELGIWNADLRNWQWQSSQLANAKFNEGKKNTFVNIATPGGGKTRAALKIAHRLFLFNQIDRVVVTVPSDHLRKQWAEDAATYGIDLDPDFSNAQIRETADYHGVVITYQSLGMNPLIHKHNCDLQRTFLIGDEWHHTGDELSWGNAAEEAFANAAYRILLSGTLFRSDGKKIPFVEYQDGYSKADYIYSYKQAIEDNVCRPVYFHTYGGEMEWKVNGKTYKHTFDDVLEEDRASERLRTALSTKGKWMRQIIREANEKLLDIRKTFPNAAGLVTAIDQQHAKSIANLFYHITGELPVIAISEDKDSSEKIKSFVNSSSKWIISVKKVTEGVDIPRIMVLLYATNVKSDLFFRQFIGRGVRVVKGWPGEQTAHIFMPADKELLVFAKEIEKEREHALSSKRNGYGDNPMYDFPVDRKSKIFEEVSAEVTHKKELSVMFTSTATDLFGLPVETAELVADTAAARKITADNARLLEDSQPIFIKRQQLRDEINFLARSKAIEKFGKNGNENIPYQHYHEVWINEMNGKPIEHETLEELERRRAWIVKAR